jgi:hypothetical protein
MKNNQFAGTWKLIACEFRTADGHIDSPFGHDALGTIIYDASGNMAVQIIRADRPNFVSGDKYNGTPEEVKKSTGHHLGPNLFILRGRAATSWPTTWPGNIARHEGWAPHRTLSGPAGVLGVGALVFTWSSQSPILALANFRRSGQRGAQTPEPAGAWPAGPGESVRVNDPYCIRLDSAVAGTSCPEAVT